MSEASGVSVVIPVHNNSATLAELTARLHAVFSNRPLQVIMVDDASSDQSAEVMRGLPVVVVFLDSHAGQNAAVFGGLRQASFPLTCVMDADLQDPPEDLPRMLARLGQGDVQVAFSSRDVAAPRFSSRLFKRMIQVLFPTLPPKPGLCLALNEQARAAILRSASDKDYIPAVIGFLRLKTASVRIRRGVRPDSGSGYRHGKRLWYAAQMLKASLRLRIKQ